MKKTQTSFFCVLLLLVNQAVADSAIVWSGEQNIEMGPGILSLFAVDVNSDGANDLSFSFLMDFTVTPQNDGSVTVSPQPPFGILDAVPLTGTTLIGADNQWGAETYSLIAWRTVPDFGLMGAGSWLQVTNGYLGFSVSSVDGIHYGWVRMTVSGDYPYAVIHDWAYESQPGTSLQAGVVPEPSTIGLMLLGCGVVMLMTWRRREQSGRTKRAVRYQSS